MVVIDEFNTFNNWGFGYVTATIISPITQGHLGSFLVKPTMPFGEGGGRMWITRYAVYGESYLPSLAGQRYLVVDVFESEPKMWYFGIQDSLQRVYEVRILASQGHLIVDLDLASNIDLSKITQISFGAEGNPGYPVPISYFAAVGYMRTEMTIPPPLPIPLMANIAPSFKNLMQYETYAFVITAIGGTPPYSYLWNDGAVGNTKTFTGNVQGDYTLYATVTDGAGAIVETNRVPVNVGIPLAPLPATEPFPTNTSHIKVTGNKIEPLHIGSWNFAFADTATGWSVGNGQTWGPESYDQWSPQNIRLNLQNMRDVFKCNMVRVQFWLQWAVDNSPYTLAGGTVSIGVRDSLHALCDIAQEEGMDVELRPYDWTDSVHDPMGVGKHAHMLEYRTKADFIEAWKTIAVDFKRHPNVMFNLWDEPANLDLATLVDTFQRTIIRIREAGVGHVIAVMGGYSGAVGWRSSGFDTEWLTAWGLTGYAHYNVCICGHEYIHHGTTQDMHDGNIAMRNIGYPIYIGAMGIWNPDDPAEMKHIDWIKDDLNAGMSVTIFHWGRPLTEFAIQQNMPFPALPNAVGQAWIDAVSQAHICPVGQHWDEATQSCTPDTPPPSFPTWIIPMIALSLIGGYIIAKS